MISATSPAKWLESWHCMLPRKLRWRWNVQVCWGNNVCKAHRASRTGRDMGLISALIIIIIIIIKAMAHSSVIVVVVIAVVLSLSYYVFHTLNIKPHLPF